VEFERELSNRRSESFEIRVFRSGGNLYDDAVIEIRAEEAAAAIGDRLPVVRLQGAAGNVGGRASAKENPAGGIFRTSPVSLEKKPLMCGKRVPAGML